MKKLLYSVILFLFSFSLFAQDGPKGLKVNDAAPEFSAMDQNGKEVKLKDQLKKGPVVLVFYRGQWCPYCNKQLMQLEDSISMISKKGASVIAISPEVAENISKTVEKTKASYPVLHDEDLKIMKSYDVAFKVDDNTVEKYKGYGIDFTKANGTANGANLPVPAVYIVSKEGKIIFSYFDKNYAKRVSIAEILAHL